jgi:hypothetical protein
VHVFVTLAVATVQPQPKIGNVWRCGVFDGENQKPGSAQRPGGSSTEWPQVTKINEGVGRDDDVEGLTLIAKKLGELCLGQVGVNVFASNVFEHSARQVNADEPRRVRAKHRPAQARAAAGVEYDEPAIWDETGVGQCVRDECGRTV